MTGRRIRLGIVIAILLSPITSYAEGFVPAPRGWSTETKISESLYQITHLVDCAQTRMIARNPDRYMEHDNAWLIGEHPNEATVAAWCVGVSALHMVGTQWLAGRNPWLSRIWQAGTIGVTLNVVGSNKSIGITVRSK